MTKRLLPIVLVVLVANAAALLMVSRNASDAPESRVRLTERELRLPTAELDNTGMTLLLAWHGPWDLHNQPAPWLTRDKLSALGFDCTLPATADGAARHYSVIAQPPRVAYIVLEYDPAWAGEVPSPTASPSTAPPVPSQSAPVAERQAVVRPSQLHAVDAGTDPGALRRRYPDRAKFLVTQGTVRLAFRRDRDGSPPTLGGVVDTILPSELYVPTEWQAPLKRLVRNVSRQVWEPLNYAPRFDVTVEYGRALMPRIVEVRAR